MVSKKLVTPGRLGKLEAHSQDIIAALLEGRSQRKVAADFGCSFRGLQLFMERHADEIMACREALAERVTDVWIADNERRIRGLDEDWRALGAIQEARAADPRHADHPGYSSGRMVHSLKSIGSGDNAMVVDEYTVDTATIAERRQLVETAAKLLGQVPSADKRAGLTREVIIREYEGVPEEWIG